MPSSYPSYADYYSNPATNPNNVTPTSSVPGGSAGAVAWAQARSQGQAVPTLGSSEYHNAVGALNYYLANRGTGEAPGMPQYPGMGGGGGGYGGGGGGGGMPMMSQEQFNAALGLLGAPVPQLDLQEVNLAPFRGPQIRPFNAGLYNRMQNRLQQGFQADRASINRTMGGLRQQLRQNYSNPYTGEFATNPQLQASMEQLVTNAGGEAIGNPYAESVNAENAYGQSSDAAFANLMNVLGASSAEDQRSRLAQVGMDQAAAMDRLRAERLGLSTGIDLSRGKAREAWQQRADERRYQNYVQRWQGNREERLRNQDIRNLERQSNYTTGVETQNARIQQLLELLGMTTGAGVDYAGVRELANRLWPGTFPRQGGGGGQGGNSEYTPRQQARRRRYKARHSGNAGEG